MPPRRGASFRDSANRSSGSASHAVRVTFCVFLVLAVASPARAYVLGANQDFDFRLRAYSEAAVAAESSEPQTTPSRVPFQLIEHRNFFNPEFDGKLTRYPPFHLDDLCPSGSPCAASTT